jgi:hypothetical protein
LEFINEEYFTILFLADAFTNSNRLEYFHEIKSSYIGITPHIVLCATTMGEIRTLKSTALEESC